MNLFFGKTATSKKLIDQHITFSEFVETLRTPKALSITEREYHALSKKERFPHKDGRYFTPCSFTSPQRLDINTEKVQLLCLDLDSAEDQSLLDPFALELTLGGFNWVMHSTVSSTRKEPRYRLLIETDGQIDPSDYAAAVLTVADLIGLDEVTPESLVACQAMFMPKRPQGSDYTFFTNLDACSFKQSDILTLENIKAVPHKYARPKPLDDDDDDMAYLENQTPQEEIHDEVILDALTNVDPDCGYQDWIMVAAALKHQFEADDERGFNIFHTWSEPGSKYEDETACLAKWHNFKANPDGRAAVTIRTLFQFAKDGGWQGIKSTDLLTKFTDMITNAESKEDLFTTIPESIKRSWLEPICREALAGQIQMRLKALGEKVGLTVIKKTIAFQGAGKDIYQSDDGTWVDATVTTPSWGKDFSYIQETDEFFKASCGHSYTEKVLNTMLGPRMLSKDDKEEGRSKPSVTAADFLVNSCLIPQHRSYTYMPGGPQVVEIEGESYVNIYKDTSDPVSDVGLMLVRDRIEEHVAWLLPNPVYQDIVLDFLAHIVQNPAERINWAILIHGPEGCGKTFFALVMAACLGARNVGSIDKATIDQQWTSWAKGKQLMCVEEIRASGSNRHATMDKLKPFLTNDMVTINERFKNEVLIPNVTSYLMFSNHADALAVTDNNRRYCILQTQPQTAGDIADQGGAQYFRRLFQVMRYPGALKKYFMDREITTDFDAKGRAPITEFSEAMVRLGECELESGLKDYLDDDIHCHPHVRTDIISLTTLRGLIECKDIPLTRPASMGHIKTVLTKLGYKSIKQRPRLMDQKLHQIWLARGVTLTSKQLVTLLKEREQAYAPDLD